MARSIRQPKVPHSSYSLVWQSSTRAQTSSAHPAGERFRQLRMRRLEIYPPPSRSSSDAASGGHGPSHHRRHRPTSAPEYGSDFLG